MTEHRTVSTVEHRTTAVAIADHSTRITPVAPDEVGMLEERWAEAGWPGQAPQPWPGRTVVLATDDLRSVAVVRVGRDRDELAEVVAVDELDRRRLRRAARLRAYERGVDLTGPDAA